MAKTQNDTVALGTLQLELERATTEYRAAKSALTSATARAARAEEAYNVAIASLTTGVTALRVRTRIDPNT